ncbi:hypothetical protein KOM00_10480 [Geomonas sp. Red69]|uniref:YXWGXW repeat-containing protein n=1 Tax=Geomonas diazotrophica TaxID=2843197 RepID=A0ABX8JN54_9BACT|nr:hypothetical protein [Geomonas diazotrophica]QWV99723.1 hypothetical protein KP005_09325 [Geomonas nitrogeniifigens]QXE88859.1 hypothetical protein KP003_09620 [Geomonas nitrogeniifigens]
MNRYLLVSLLLIGILGRDAAAEVSLSINIGPPVVVGAPPAMVMVPGTSVYFAPGLDVDIFFYGGYWWSPRGNRWYRSTDYDGPWRTVARSSVPRTVYRVPREYREIYAKERHIPYGQWKKEGHGGNHRGRGHGRGND